MKLKIKKQKFDQTDQNTQHVQKSMNKIIFSTEIQWDVFDETLEKWGEGKAKTNMNKHPNGRRICKLIIYADVESFWHERKCVWQLW